jgi:hypothetical protein
MVLKTRRSSRKLKLANAEDRKRRQSVEGGEGDEEVPVNVTNQVGKSGDGSKDSSDDDTSSSDDNRQGHHGRRPSHHRKKPPVAPLAPQAKPSAKPGLHLSIPKA